MEELLGAEVTSLQNLELNLLNYRLFCSRYCWKDGLGASSLVVFSFGEAKTGTNSIIRKVPLLLYPSQINSKGLKCIGLNTLELVKYIGPRTMMCSHLPNSLLEVLHRVWSFRHNVQDTS